MRGEEKSGILDFMQTEALPGQPESAATVELSPPPGLNMPLWRSLLQNLRDAFAHQEPAPVLTSKPVEVGMLLGDRVELPWYRTVFTNIGEAVTPEEQPPLELESHPVDVGELISDQLQRRWWASLLRNLADTLAPERQAPIHLTSAPVQPPAASTRLCVPQWSELIERQASPVAPSQVSLSPRQGVIVQAPTFGMPANVPLPPDDSGALKDLTEKAQRALRFSRYREAVWISLAGAEVVGLLVLLFTQK